MRSMHKLAHTAYMTHAAAHGTVPAWDLTDRLVKARKHAGMTQTEFAMATGISRRSVINYEAGHTKPRRPELLAWAFSSGVSLEWLENGESPQPGGPDGGSQMVRHQGLEPRTRWFSAAPGVTRLNDQRRSAPVPHFAVADEAA